MTFLAAGQGRRRDGNRRKKRNGDRTQNDQSTGLCWGKITLPVRPGDEWTTGRGTGFEGIPAAWSSFFGLIMAIYDCQKPKKVLSPAGFSAI